MKKSRERVSPIQKIARAAAEAVAEQIMSCFEDNPLGDTPIEKIFHAAFRAYIENICGCSDLSIAYVGRGRTLEERLQERVDWIKDPISTVVWVDCQSPLGPYKADFTLSIQSWRDEKWRTLVVECDGHDYHERTKQQAAHDRSRDRWMIENGYTVFRFTGSELYRDPVKCAEQVFDMLMKMSATGA